MEVHAFIVRVIVMVIMMVFGKSNAQIASDLDKYTYLKVMMGCLGSRAVIGWRREMVAASDKCLGTQVSTPPTLDLSQYLESIGVSTQINPTYIQFPTYQTNVPSRAPQYIPQILPQYYQPFLYNNMIQYYQQQYTLANQYLKGWANLKALRGADPDAAAAELKDALAARLSNITCILREVKMLDAEDRVNYDHIRQELLGVVAGQLREELSAAEGACRAFSRCQPPQGPSAHPLARHLGPAIVYNRCLAQKKMAACMRQDLRKLGAEIGWQGGNYPLISLLETPVLQQVEDLMLGPSGIPDLLV